MMPFIRRSPHSFFRPTWGGLDWDDDWYVREGEPGPGVLTGPLDAPMNLQEVTLQ